MGKAYAIAFFILVIASGYWITRSSWNGEVYVPTMEKRSPSSLRRWSSFSAVDVRALSRTAGEQVIAHAKFEKQESILNLTLGNPLLVNGTEATREFACESAGRQGIFSRVQVTLYGTGISDNGDQPLMVVDLACATGKTLDVLAPITIPMADILSSQPQDQEIQIPGDHQAFIRLQNIPDQWPDTWVLWGVKFYTGFESDSEFELNAQQLRQSMPQLPQFTWN
jgi:hypothetical protein